MIESQYSYPHIIIIIISLNFIVMLNTDNSIKFHRFEQGFNFEIT